MHKQSIIIVGPFPPPVTGLSTINERMARKLISNSINVIKLNTSPGTLKKNQKYIFKRITSIISASIFLFRYKLDKKTKLYCSVSAQKGKLFEIIFVAIARLKMMRIVLHHHSYLYICKKQLLARILFKISGKKCVHIVLSNNMDKLLKEKYKTILNTMLLSNIYFISESQNIKKHKYNDTIKTIGFLSNISFEKGIDIFLKLVTTLRNNGINIISSISGIIYDENVSSFLHSYIENDNSIKYWGSVYGKRKIDFFNNIDLLVLPSRNEAEPLVVYEAMENGIPVISYGVGCVSEQIGDNPDAGLIVDLDDNFVELTSKWIHLRIESPELYAKSCKAALDRYTNLKIASNGDFEKYYSNIIGVNE